MSPEQRSLGIPVLGYDRWLLVSSLNAYLRGTLHLQENGPEWKQRPGGPEIAQQQVVGSAGQGERKTSSLTHVA